MDYSYYISDNKMGQFMKNKYFYIILILSLNISSLALSKVYKLKAPKGELSYTYKLPNWIHRKNFMGFRNAFTLSTQDKNKTSSITITSTQTKIALDSNKLTSDQNDYKRNKLQWLKKYNIHNIAFEKFKIIREGKISIFSMGVNYTTNHLGNVKERTYLVSCEDQSLFYIKSLLLQEHFSQEEVILQFLTSIEGCQVLN